MLHTISPLAYLSPAHLHDQGKCPECGQRKQLQEGVVGFLHYQDNGGIAHALVWVCSPLCILNFENSRYMGHC